MIINNPLQFLFEGKIHVAYIFKNSKERFNLPFKYGLEKLLFSPEVVMHQCLVAAGFFSNFSG
jgi:hypothetical protein